MSQAEETGTVVERMLVVKAVPVLGDLDPEELALVAERTSFREFAPGETVFSGVDTPVTTIHLVLGGRVAERRGGRPFRTHGPQHVVGGLEALADTPTDVVAVAEVATRTLAIERSDLRDILADNFAVLGATLQGVAAAALRLRRAVTPSAGFPVATAAPAADGDELAERIAFLHARTLLGGMPIRALGHVAGEAEQGTLVAGARLWSEGEPAEHAVVVTSGIVDCTSADGRHRFQAGPGTILGFEDALALEARWYGAVARDGGTVLRLERAALVDLLEDEPDAALALLAALAATATALRDGMSGAGA